MRNGVLASLLDLMCSNSNTFRVLVEKIEKHLLLQVGRKFDQPDRNPRTCDGRFCQRVRSESNRAIPNSNVIEWMTDYGQT